MSYMNPAQSKAIASLRFPMTYLVVLLHTILQNQVCNGQVYAPTGRYPLFDAFVFFMQRCVGDLAVPVFFFISGYLFFSGGTFSTITYKQKIYKRFRTLFVPYFLWNLMFMVYMFIVFFTFPSLLSSMKSYCEEFSLRTFLLSFWNLNGSPVLAPFWFIRDLIVINLFALPIHYLLKRIPKLFVSTLFVFWIFLLWKDVPGLGVRSVFFYVLGAFFSITDLNFIETFKRYSVWVTCLYILLSVLETIHIVPIEINAQVHQLTLVLGVITIITLFSVLCENQWIITNSVFSQSSFFIFSLHMFIINFPNKIWPLFLPVNTFTLCMMQVLIPAFVCLVCLGVYLLSRRVAPTFLSILTGGRAC